MSDKPRLRVVLCWHMHQPFYLDPVDGTYRLPWTYLHAMKDYVDMVAHLEEVPGARAVVNFTPTLLEQIDHYATAVRRYLANGDPIPDPLLSALAGPDMPADADSRAALVKACLRANEKHLIHRFPAYQRLAEMGDWIVEHPKHAAYLCEEYLADVVVWYHLAWLGETVRLHNNWVRALLARGSNFTLQERRKLLELIGELLSGVVERYRRLAEDGRVELSVTPYAHPILPLMLDLNTALEAVPRLPLPAHSAYPGGEERAQWHIREGLEVFERHFGFRPKGCWPAEGGVSEATLALLEQAGFEWAATGEQVLRNSLHKHIDPEGPTQVSVHRPYHLPGGKLACFSRDDGLSDLIGFTYSGWHADDAVANLAHHLENIALARRNEPDTVVSIILDGENAWEHYPKNGYYFLHALYRKLTEHPQFELTTFADCLGEQGVRPARLAGMVAGSWVYGTFTTWIGHPDKNRAWDMLIEAKQVFDQEMSAGRMDDRQRKHATHQLAVCEGSDWFWWFGDDNPAESVQDFDELFRRQLSSLYQLLGREPPEYLAHAFSHGGGSAVHGGVMRPGVKAAP